MGRANLTDEMRVAIVCREYGWTFDQYMDQPESFINTIESMLSEEAKEASRKKI